MISSMRFILLQFRSHFSHSVTLVTTTTDGACEPSFNTVDSFSTHIISMLLFWRRNSNSCHRVCYTIEKFFPFSISFTSFSIGNANFSENVSRTYSISPFIHFHQYFSDEIIKQIDFIEFCVGFFFPTLLFSITLRLSLL